MTKTFGLPQELGDGLLLRWAAPDDAEELAEFNIRIHSDNPEEPDAALGVWTQDLMDGQHPTTKADDFTLVVDTTTGQIVSSLNLISQTWEMDGVAFGVGRPELVGTDPAYRKRGLIRAQMEAIHAKSAARGELAQAITGIPWYYRLFGYEMALDLGGGRPFFWQRKGNDKPVEAERFSLRPAGVADIPVLSELYAAHCQRSLVSRRRDEVVWRYELTKPHRQSPYFRNFQMVESGDGEIVAYAAYRHWGNRFVIREVGVAPGCSWREVGLFLTRTLKKEAEVLSKGQEKRIEYISFSLGCDHPIYDALGRQLERQSPAYAWYIRVADLPAFLWHMAPVLEKRLAQSVLAGYSGKMRLNF